MKIYRQLARLLADHGVTTVFGVMGDGNMHWVAAYRELDGCRWRPAWHEAGAVWMADGFAAATGDVGVATVTMGPGLAQSLAALTTAVRVRRPLLLITAEVPQRVPAEAQQANQRDWVHACGARYLQVAAAVELPAALTEALHSARAGDVTVLAIDIALFTQVAPVPTPVPTPEPVARPASAPEPDLTAAVAVLQNAAAPLVVIGRGVLAADSLDPVLALGRRMGAVFATTLGGRTVLPDEPFDLGVIGMMADPLTREVARQADVVLVLGAALDRYNTDGGAFARAAHIVRVDVRPASQLWSPSDRNTWVTGELAAVVHGLGDRLDRTAAATGLRTPELHAELVSERARQDALAESEPVDGPNPWAAVGVLDELLPADAYVVLGIGHFWYFVAPYLRPAPNRRFHFANGFGLIGQALPVAVGAAIALAGSRPVIAVEGDGSLPMNVQELQAAVRHDADLLLIVLNNRAYGSEFHKLALSGLDVAASEFDETPFDVPAVAQALGATARRTSGPAELRAALAELLPQRGVRVIDVEISRSTMSEAYVRQHVTGADNSSH
jgi:acetolactate synthase-1/2/3 large subunit